MWNVQNTVFGSKSAQLHHIVCRRLGMSPFWPYSDVVRPCPLRSATLWHGVSCHSWTGVGRRREFGEISCTQPTATWMTLKLIDPNGKNGNLEGYFGSEFSAIYDHCGVGDLKSQDVKFLKEIFAFFGKTTPIDVLCSNFVKFGRREIGEIVRYLPDKKFRLDLQLSLLYGSARASPATMYSQCFGFHKIRFTFSGVIAERMNTAQTRRKVIKSESNMRLKHSLQPNNYC